MAESIQRRGERLAATTGLAVAVLGGLVLFGWADDVRWLQTPLAGTRAMVPNTALMLALLGVGLAALAPPARTGAVVMVGRVAALGSGAIALLTLGEYVLATDLGIDRVVLATDPGRPAPNTAVVMLSTSIALLTLDRTPRRGPALAELVAAAVVAHAVLVLTGYVYGATEFATPPALPEGIGMAVHTAVGTLLLGVGIIAARPRRGWTAVLTSDRIGGVVGRRILLAIVLVIPAADLVSVFAQRAEVYSAAGTAVVHSILSAIALLGAVLVIASMMNRADAERARAQAALRVWTASLDAAAFGAVITGPDGQIEQANEAFARMHGRDRADLVGRPIAEVTAPGERERLSARFAEVAARGTARFETEGLRADGRTFPVAVDVTAIEVVAGRPSRTIAYVQDITEEHEARAMQARLAALVAVAEDAIIATTVDGVVSEWNPGAERLYGLAAADIVGRTLDAIVPEDRRDEHVALIARFKRGEPVTGFETERLHRDRRRIPVSLTWSPISDAHGATVGICSIERDVTERRLAEDATRRAYQQESLQRTWLESILSQMPQAVLVADARGAIVLENDGGRGFHDASVAPLERAVHRGETTSGLELELHPPSGETIQVLASATPVRHGSEIVGAVAVFHDIRPLKELERLRTEWTSLIAHDLRQPVNALRLASDLLLRGPLNAKAASWVERIRAEAGRLDTMIEDLLDASRIEARQLSVHARPVELVELIALAGERVRDLAARLHVRIAPDLVLVDVDPGRIIQVLGNLLSNAVKYSDPDTPIEVDAAGTGDLARISVTSFGPELTAADQAALFQRFSRTERARRSGIEGVGLGLYLCKGLVEAHGGRIEVSSAHHRTTFTITVPRAADPAGMVSA